VGESARFSGGADIELDRVPLKYAGMDPWEIWVSESQERMTVAVAPADLDAFVRLSHRHAVESTVIGTYTASGRLHIRFNGRSCAYIDLNFLDKGFAQWRFKARWTTPQDRGLTEPVIGAPLRLNDLLLDMLSRPNICAKNWIARQYDHEVQGTSVVKPLVGAARDVNSDAAVIRPVLSSTRALAFSQALLPQYSAIDAYHMTACTIDEAVRRLIAVGADPDQIGGVDNFCWPSITPDPIANPDGPFKAAQLVRACKALADTCLAYGIPLLSGKDSMYVDGHLAGAYGETHKVSALETLQFSATGIVTDVDRCVTLDAKAAGDRVYVIGITGNELGASEYYELLGEVGCHVPMAAPAVFWPVYQCLHAAIDQQLAASVHGVYRGGLAVHLAMVAMAGRLGLTVDLAAAPTRDQLRDDALLFSESAGRFVVTVAGVHCPRFERLMAGMPVACVGKVTTKRRLVITRGAEGALIDLPVADLVNAWQRPFGGLR
jgi:phosphoribosylformylglycinamidine synthase